MTYTTTGNQRSERGAATRLAVQVVALTVAALALRAALAARSGLWGDECLFLFVTRLPSWGEMFSFLRWNESHPPLFYVLVRAWLGVVGVSDGAALALPVLFSAALVPVGFWLSRRADERLVPGIVAVALLLSPTLTEFGVQVRPYGLLQLLGLASSFALYRAWRSGAPGAWGLYAASASAIVYTHNWGWIVLAGQAGIGLALLAVARRLSVRALLPLALSLGAVALVYLPWAPALLYQSRHAGHAPIPLGVIASKILFKLGLGAVPPIALGLLLGLGALAGILVFARFALRQGAAWAQGERTVFFAFFLAAPLLSVLAALLLSGKSDLMKMRCLSILLPTVLVGAVSLAVSVVAARPALRVPALGLGALLAVNALWGMGTLYRTPKSNAREVAAALSALVRDSDLILIAPQWFASPFNWYFKGANPQIDYPDPGRVEAMRYDHVLERHQAPAPFEEARAALGAARAAGRRIWFVTDADFQPSGREPSPPLPPTAHWMEAGMLRADQLYTQLVRWYGAGDETAVPGGGAGAEIRVVLFAPGEREAK